MDLSNLITASNYTIPKDGIANPLLNKITEVTGYHWKMYFPNTSIMNNMYPVMHNFFLHNWIGAVVGILMLVVIGEILFYGKIKKDKVEYTESNNFFILKNKVMAYFISFFMCIFIVMFIPTIGLMTSIFLLNLHIFIVVLIMIMAYAIVLCLGVGICIKIIVTINKTMFGHLIKKETQEEYEKRQATYKFRDGILVKIKPNIIEDVRIEDHKATPRLERMSKEGNTYIIKNHNNKGKVFLRDEKDNGCGMAIRECWIQLVSTEEKETFLKEQAEYKIKEVKRNKKLINRFVNWCMNIE